MKLTKIDDARNIIFDNISESLKEEYVPIERSTGRVLDEDIISPLDMPSFNRSKMDGWAIRSEDTPGKFKITGYLQAGALKESFTGTEDYSIDDNIHEFETYKIMTGAPVIKGADAVLQIEKCTVTGDCVVISEAVKKDDNIARKGEDIQMGQNVLSKGTVLNGHHISLIASAGYAQIRVKKKLKVSIIVTGNELEEPSYSSQNSSPYSKLETGRIYNSNAWTFLAMCEENNLDAYYVGTAGDTLQEFNSKIEDCSDSDIIIISGGVSVGDYDLVREGLIRYRAKELFYKVASKPGKPLLVCQKDSTLIFGFPGNPVSCMVSFREFLMPAVRKLYGQKNFLPIMIPAIFSGTYSKEGDRDHFISIELRRDGDLLIASEIKSNSSGDTVSFANSQALLRVKVEKINNGDVVEVELI